MITTTSRSRFSDHRGAVLGGGIPAEELFGVRRDRPRHGLPNRRGPAASARRRAKRLAKAQGVTLKSFLRRVAKTGTGPQIKITVKGSRAPR